MTGLLLLYVGSLVSEHGLGQNLSHQLVEGIALCGLEDACWVSFFSGNVVLCVLYLQSFWDAYQLRQNYVRKRTYARISAPLVFSAMATVSLCTVLCSPFHPLTHATPSGDDTLTSEGAVNVLEELVEAENQSFQPLK